MDIPQLLSLTVIRTLATPKLEGKGFIWLRSLNHGSSWREVREEGGERLITGWLSGCMACLVAHPRVAFPGVVPPIIGTSHTSPL